MTGGAGSRTERINRVEVAPFDPDSPGRPLHLTAPALGLVAVGGAVGTLARYGLARAWSTPADGWPWATLIANLAGSLVLGLLLAALAVRGDDTGGRRRLRLLLGTGFCGGLTTYSTFAVECAELLRDGRVARALVYAAVSVGLGLLLAAVGLVVGRRLPAGGPPC